MRFRRIICIVLCLICLLGAANPATATETDLSVTAGCRSVDAAKAIGGSEALADVKAALVYERTTGTLVYSYNIDDLIYPSSMVKLMTALVALEQGDPDAVVTVTRSALDSVAIGSVSAGLVRGEEITLRDLLYCMMVASANDAAAVIAEHIGGSQSGFVALMNEKAEQIGCTGTHFSNAHGLHDEQTYTTARDILRLLNYCLANEKFKTLFEAVNYTVPATNLSPERYIITTNYMMSKEYKKNYFDERVTGGKTGATDAAGRCLAVTAKVGDMELVAIVMGAKATYASDGLSLTKFGSFEAMDTLLDYVQSGFECRQLFYEGQVIAQYSVDGGSNNAVTTPVSDGFCVLPKGITAEELVFQYDRNVEGLKAPVEKGQAIGTIEVWYGNICLANTVLAAMNGVSEYVAYEEPKSTTDQKNEKAHGEILAKILGIAFGVVLAAIIGMFLIRVVQTAVIKARVRRRRKNRRRNRNARME